MPLKRPVPWRCVDSGPLNRHHTSHAPLGSKAIMRGRKHTVTLKPAPNCALCGTAWTPACGPRVISQKGRSLRIADKKAGGWSWASLSDGRFLGFQGQAGEWTESAKDRAITAAEAGLRPWYCSQCAHRTCSQCGHALNSPVGCAWIGDKGCIGQSPLLSANPGCINADCSSKAKRN
jgi:hypothetical protein